MVCTLFALLVRLLCAKQKRNVCASALPCGKVFVESKVVGLLVADSRILSRYVKILNADGNFLCADRCFLFADSNFHAHVDSFLRSVVK